MAIQVGGTTVIDNSRNLVNVGNLKTVGGQSLLGSGDISINSGPYLFPDSSSLVGSFGLFYSNLGFLERNSVTSGVNLLYSDSNNNQQTVFFAPGTWRLHGATNGGASLWHRIA